MFGYVLQVITVQLLRELRWRQHEFLKIGAALRHQTTLTYVSFGRRPGREDRCVPFKHMGSFLSLEFPLEVHVIAELTKGW